MGDGIGRGGGGGSVIVCTQARCSVPTTKFFKGSSKKRKKDVNVFAPSKVLYAVVLCRHSLPAALCEKTEYGGVLQRDRRLQIAKQRDIFNNCELCKGSRTLDCVL